MKQDNKPLSGKNQEQERYRTLQVVFSVPATFSIVFSFSASVPPSEAGPVPFPLLIAASLEASVWMSRTCLSVLVCNQTQDQRLFYNSEVKSCGI